MAVGFSNTNKPLNPRGNDASPKGYNRAALYSGKALDFDGVNDQITLGTISDLTFGTGDFSVVLDWQIDSVSTYSWAIAKNPVTDLGIGINNTGGLLRLWIGGTLSLGTENILGSDWKKIAVVRESGVVSAYINGVAISLTETAMAGSIDSGELFVGSWVSNADFWNGLLNNIRIFNTALTAAQVADLYNNPEKVVPTGVDNTALKLWLPMQEGAGTTAYDGSGNGNHGTISGATYTHGIGAPVSQTAVIDWNKGTNLLEYSEQFNESSYWTPLQSTITANDTTAPDGQTTADKLLASATNNNHQVDGTFFSIVSGAVTSSIYAKKGNTDFVRLRHNSTTQQIRAWFDLENGVVGSVDAGGTATIEDVGNGWYRCTMTESGNVKTGLASLQIFINESDNQTTWAADGDEYIYIWGASFEQSATAGPYVRTGATAQTSPVLLPQGLTSGRDITGVNLFENVRKQGALNLDGNSWAEVHDNSSLDITDAITLEAWVYWDDSVSHGFLGKWDYSSGKASYLILKISETKFRFYVSSTGSNASLIENGTTITNGWNHIVGVYDGTNIKCYLNGSVDGSAAYSDGLFPNDLNLEIGKYASAKYPNNIAQPRIYNRALTAEEVQRNYNAGKNIYTNS